MDNRPPILLDSSFLIALERETRQRRAGRAMAMLPRLRGRKVCISVVAVAEVLEGAEDRDEAARALARFAVQPLAWAQARRCAVLQSRAERPLGENDAWIAGTALVYEATLIGRERAFIRVPRLDYLAF